LKNYSKILLKEGENMSFVPLNIKTNNYLLKSMIKIKELVKELVKMYPNADINIFNSMFRVNPNTTKNIE